MTKISWIESILTIEAVEPRPIVHVVGPNFESMNAKAWTETDGIHIEMGGSFADNLEVFLRELATWMGTELAPLMQKYGFSRES